MLYFFNAWIISQCSIWHICLQHSHLELTKQSSADLLPTLTARMCMHGIRSLSCPVALLNPKERLHRIDLPTVVQANLPMWLLLLPVCRSSSSWKKYQGETCRQTSTCRPSDKSKVSILIKLHLTPPETEINLLRHILWTKQHRENIKVPPNNRRKSRYSLTYSDVITQTAGQHFSSHKYCLFYRKKFNLSLFTGQHLAAVAACIIEQGHNLD